MDKAIHLYPEDIFPLVQEGKNKIITLDQLLHEMHEMIEHHHHHDCDFEDPCSCEKALYEAKQADTKAAEALCNSLEALDSAKSAFLAANKAFDLSKETKTLAENNESRITSLESNLCSINVRLDVLDKKIDDTAAKVKVTMKAVESSTDYQYTFYQGIDQIDSNIVGIVTVPKTDATLTLAGKPADAAAVGQQFTNIKDLIEQVKNELNTTQAGSGLSTTGEYIKNVTAHYINNAASLADADTILDQAIYDSNIKINKNIQDISDLKVSVTNLGSGVKTATILKNNVTTTVNPDANGNLDLTSIKGTTALAGLTDDVTLTTPTTGDILYYNGTKWVNTNLNTLITDKVNELIDAKLLWTRVASDATTTSASGYVLKPKVAANDAISVGYAYSTNA